MNSSIVIFDISMLALNFTCVPVNVRGFAKFIDEAEYYSQELTKWHDLN